MDFGLGTVKGGVGGFDANGNLNTVTQDPFVWAPMTEARSRYTGRAVVENFTAAAAQTAFVLGFEAIIADSKLAVGNVVVDGTATTAYTAATSNGVTTITLNAAPGADKAVKIAYEYDNEVIPQEKLPTMVGQMKGITLQARARRIAVQYSQFAAFQS